MQKIDCGFLIVPLSLHADPNVEVVYISPVTLDQEIVDYCGSLLATGPSGSQSAMERVSVVTPDISLPPHPLPLSSLLTLNPRYENQLLTLCEAICYIVWSTLITNLLVYIMVNSKV